MKFTLRLWRQSGPDAAGGFEVYTLDGVDADDSFLEMLDTLNHQLVSSGRMPVAFDHDCREGICGACSLVIDGVPHGPRQATTTCQLYMRCFRDGQTITVEPWRAGAFPIIRDLVVDRSALDRVMQAGGYVSVNTGSAPDAGTLPVAKDCADNAFEAAACIGCGACVAACPNTSAMLFVAARVGQFSYLPQGQVEQNHRAIVMVEAMDAEGFGNCSNHYECAVACPKSVPKGLIAKLNREFLRAALTSREFAHCSTCSDYEE